ncbi:uncharacterized protein H6S33_005187 [Morchella sextelata]|uniref:uncharacterized protein n=1 Tax=Morchella sextelata TaxID=1174677 RepID=UPI001D059F13|nr:uncharacterized protein H6S33_005187 [Morchella sextelata]KAH0605205.1 hypothetical protein H6S33_005187 [Morchella sextelata]
MAHHGTPLVVHLVLLSSINTAALLPMVNLGVENRTTNLFIVAFLIAAADEVNLFCIDVRRLQILEYCITDGSARERSLIVVLKVL